MAIKPRVFVTVRNTKRPQRAKSPYIDGCFEAMGVMGSVYINSQIPSSSGLGSSAAVTVATLSAINDEFSLHKTREEIANMAFEIEKNVQKGSGEPHRYHGLKLWGDCPYYRGLPAEACTAEPEPCHRGLACLAQYGKNGRTGRGLKKETSRNCGSDT